MRYDQLREQEALKTPLPFTKAPFPLPGDHKFQDGGVFISTFNSPSAKEESPLHMAISHIHNPYLDLKPPPADKQKPQTNDIHHVYVPYKYPTVLSTITTTPTTNSTKTKDLKTPAVSNNEVIHDVATHPVLEAELPSLPHLRRSLSVIQSLLTHLQMIPVKNNQVIHAVGTHSVLGAEPPRLPPVRGSLSFIQLSLTHSSFLLFSPTVCTAKRSNMIPPVRRYTLDIPSPTEIEVIDLTIDTSENSSDEPPKKKGKTTTIDVMVIVTMPGLVDPVVKKVQCTVDQESD